MDMERERELFEEVFHDSMLEKQGTDGNYINTNVHAQWVGWKKRALYADRNTLVVRAYQDTFCVHAQDLAETCPKCSGRKVPQDFVHGIID